VTARLPLFPLGTVLFPGLVLPLHIFEERYRLLIRELLEEPRPRRFGVVGIELGHEVGDGAARRLAPVGCTAEIRVVNPHDDGRFDVVTVGGERFRLLQVDDSRPYLSGEVEFLPEEAGTEPDAAAGRVGRLFRLYRLRLEAAGAPAGDPVELPDDPVRLSYLIAGAMVLDQRDKQRLLEAADATQRLWAEHELLRREIRLLDALPTVPAGRLIEGAVHPN